MAERSPRGRFVKGKSGNPAGKRPGTLNRTTTALKEAVLEAFEKGGGVKWLRKLMDEDPRTFVSLLARILPAEMKHDLQDAGLVVSVRDYSGLARAELPRNGETGVLPASVKKEPGELGYEPVEADLEAAEPAPEPQAPEPAPPPPQGPAPISDATYRRLWGDAERPNTAIF